MTDAAGSRRRALLVTTDYPPDAGGIQTMAREIAARTRRFDLQIVAPDAPDAKDWDDASPVPVRRARALVPSRWGGFAGLAVEAARAARAFRPQVILAMHALAAPAGTIGRTPLVLVCHGGELRSRRIRSVARIALRRAERVVANSRFTRSAAIALGADPLRVSVLPVGAPEPKAVDLAAVAAIRARDGGGRIVLSVARLVAHKGQDVLVRALPDLPEDVRVVLVGDGPERDALEATARDAGFAGRVRFAGTVADDELSLYYAASDVFALLSRATAGGVEGGGIAALEAMAYGVPVVAAATGGLPETVRDGETGFLVDPEDPKAVARVLRRALEEGDEAARVAAAGRTLATGERSWARFVERMETVMELAATRSTEGLS